MSLLVRPRYLLAGLLSVLLSLSISITSNAEPFVWARASDALTLDPHAVNDGSTHALSHQIYEPLLIRDYKGKLEPALAASWRQQVNPLVWTFKLRPGVTFHDGQPLTAEDVVFSLTRALSPTSDLRTRLQGVDTFKAVGTDQIEITTHVADPLLPIRLTDIFIMNKAWSESHGATKPQNLLAGEATYASKHTNGTGPYKLISREPGKETKLTRNESYWGWRDTDVARRISEISYRPMPNDKERITSLLAGTIDFVQDVPIIELDVLRQAPNLQLNVGPENRVIFLGLSVKSELNGKPNPLAKHEAREAIAIAVDRLDIQTRIMKGQSIPTAVLAPPGINGFPSDLDNIPPRDLDAARKLLQTAGVSDGLQMNLDCPNNRYVNDAAICKAIASQLAEIGLKVTPVLRAKGPHFSTVRSGKSQLFLLGWGVPTFDSAYIFTNLFHTATPGLGNWNGTGFSNLQLDERIASLSNLIEPGARARSMAHIWQSAREARIYVPLHVQTLIYAMRKGIDIPVDISNVPKLKHAVVLPEAERAQ